MQTDARYRVVKESPCRTLRLGDVVWVDGDGFLVVRNGVGYLSMDEYCDMDAEVVLSEESGVKGVCHEVESLSE